MHSTDDLSPVAADGSSARSSSSPVSVALLAAVACVPIVVAAGFILDRPAGGRETGAVPGDISALSLRGDLDTVPDRRPNPPMRAGY